VVAGDVNLEAVQTTVAGLGAPHFHAVRCDVTKLGDVEALAAAAMQHLGGVDLLINNAGVAVAGPVGDVPLDSWRWIVDVNLWGPIHGCHVFLPLLRRQGSGHILNVASIAGLCAAPNLGPYNATKSALVALSETLYSELAGTGVGVSVLCPTFFQTSIADSAHMHGDPTQLELVRGLMSRAKIQANDVARIALDRAARGDLYILPHRDGRLLWGFKRFFPRIFHRLTPKLLAWRSRSLP
jgi:NAD(P)-dependent dehydrogenase (short-subunit alcohol dehydrogenase family)